ncbi:MAG: riboflavin synthase alpha subunit, partial [Ilumatobacter sp.]
MRLNWETTEMFTGIVEELGEIIELDRQGARLR